METFAHQLSLWIDVIIRNVKEEGMNEGEKHYVSHFRSKKAFLTINKCIVSIMFKRRLLWKFTVNMSY